MDVESLEKIMEFVKTVELSAPMRKRLLDEIRSSIHNRIREAAVMEWIKNHPEQEDVCLLKYSQPYGTPYPPIGTKPPGPS